MKKYFLLLLILTSLIAISCENSKNYEMKSEMNKLYPIEIVYFDSNSQKELGEFPVNRNVYIKLIEKIEKDKPAYIILKYFFDTEKKEDNDFAKTLRGYKNILTQATTGLSQVRITPNSVLEHLALKNVTLKTHNFNEIVLPNETLLPSFAGIGMVDFITKNDEYRDCPIVSEVNGFYLPSLALKIGMMVTNSEPIINNNVLYLNGKEISVPNGMFKINLSKPKSLYKTYSFIDVLNKKIQEMNFKNKIVILFIEDPSVRFIKSDYIDLHNNAEIVADSINTMLERLE